MEKARGVSTYLVGFFDTQSIEEVEIASICKPALNHEPFLFQPVKGSLDE